MPMQRRILQVLSIVVILTMLFSGVSLPSASALEKDGLKRQINPQTGRVSFIGPENGLSLPASQALGIASPARPADPALTLAKRFGPEFGLQNPGRDLSPMKTHRLENGRIIARYQQSYQGIPVMGGELIVNTNDSGDLYSVNGEVSPDLSLSTQPTIDSEAARQTALQAAAKRHQKTAEDFHVSEPALWIFDESLLQPSIRPAELVWRMEVTSKEIGMPVRELVLVNAQRGSISLHFNQIDTAWSSSAIKQTIQDFQSTATPLPTETPFPTETPEPVITEIRIADELASKEELSVSKSSVSKVTTLTGAIWYVTPTGNDSNLCSTFALPCATINGAIDKAGDGDTIYVSSGLYQGKAAIVGITKSLTILGGWNTSFSAQTGYSILDGTGNPANTILVRTYTSTTIERLIIRNAAGGINTANGNPCTPATSVIVRQSSITDMTDWGAIMNCVTLSLINSTVYNNRAGAIDNLAGTVMIQNSTITNNSYMYDSGGVRNIGSGFVSIQNSILTGNTIYETPKDCVGTITSTGYNIIGTTSGCTITLQASDKIGVNPQLGPLLSNGYFPLLSNSPAIDAGGSCPSIDQRGVSRPQGNACDIGAYEYAVPGNVTKLVILDGNNQHTPPNFAFPQLFRVAALDNQDNLVPDVNVTFTAPISGASGKFANTGTNISTVVSNSNGIATASTFSANMQTGDYTVIASASGASSVNFNLQNSAFYVATSGNDANSCMTVDSPCATINGAINKANAGDAVAVATGLYTGTGLEVVLINKNLTLTGGWNNTFTLQNSTSIIDGRDARGGISVNNGISAVLDRFTIQNGKRDNGGGIANYHGTLTISNTTIRQNHAGWLGSGSGGGGGILNTGTLTLNNSTVNNNIVIGDLYGGGIDNSGTLILNNSTVSSNTGGHAALYNEGNLTINNSTITRNRPYGIQNVGGPWPGTVTLKNTILAGNGIEDGISGDCSGTIISEGYNLVGIKPAECTFNAVTGDMVGTRATPINPRLTLLQDNSGSTFTHGLITGSPAIDAGNPAASGSGVDTCLGTDQRGVTRPVGPRCDIGAYEGSVLWAPPYRVSTYTANHSSSLPGSLLCDQTDPACSIGDFRASAAHEYAIGTYNLYANQFLRDSLDNKGMTIISTINYLYNNDSESTFWNGSQVVYGDYLYKFLMADDAVAHELTHGVTQYESNLFYYYQSGAINESLSDLWGEYYDQTNGQGDDALSVRWLVGEDIFIPGVFPGVLRSMSDPPAFNDPDKMSSPSYYADPYNDGIDNGGIHINSGVNNKAAYLMVDGGSFNGRTVMALGWDKTAAIYYEVNTNLLSSGADYSDLYYALQQACTNLIGQKGITAGDCGEVKDAIDAVEMNGQPTPNFNTDAPYCDAGNPVTTIFSDDLESGTGNWTLSNGAYPRWQWDSPYGAYAQSGAHFLYADDYPGAVTDATAQMVSLTLPNNAYLRFAQAYDFERYGSTFYDGGVLEYSIDNGLTWVDAGSLIDFNGYKGMIYNGYYPSPTDSNPLKGRSAFVGTSHGYISTRLNLAPLAGQTVSFRWRMGLDYAGVARGWWVDDVRIYQCPKQETTPTNTSTPTSIVTFTPTNTPTATPTGTRTPTATRTPTKTTTPTATPTLTATGTGMPTATQTATNTPTFTPTSVSTGTNTPTATQTPTNALSPTSSPTPTATKASVGGSDRDTTGVFRPSNGLLYLKNKNETGFADLALNYGLGGDYPVVGDWNGNGDATIGVYRNGQFMLRNSNTLGFAEMVFAFGQIGDQPIAGDWDGDGVDTIGVYRPSTGQFLLRNSNSAGPAEMSFYLGNVGDVGIAGDWDGDGKDTTGVFRPINGIIFLKNSNETGFAEVALNYGIPGDRPVTGDWDYDGIDTIGVYRNGQFLLRNSNTVGFADIAFGLGSPGDMPIAGNWDGIP